MASRERETPVRIIYRKKKGHGHGHHGGAWKVAFADFMTAMFALFLVLWLVNQSSDVKSAIAGYFQDPLGRANEHGSSILPGEGAQASTPRPLSPMAVVDLRRDRLQRFAEDIEKKLGSIPELATVREFIEITLTDEGLRIQLLEDPSGVFFQTGRALPSEKGAKLLGILGQELGRISNAVRIEGHTDARPYSRGGPYGNWELSADRANAARRIMTGAGLAAGQVTEVRGFADRQPRTPDDPFAASNRRISILVLIPAASAADSIGPVPERPTDVLQRVRETGAAS